MKTETAPPTPADIEEARKRLVGIARETPVYGSETFSRIAGRDVLLKAENLQRTGAFKVRGAFNRIATLSADERAAGVVAASAGNHGQAVAWAAREAGDLGADLRSAGRADGEGRGLPHVRLRADHGRRVLRGCAGGGQGRHRGDRGNLRPPVRRPRRHRRPGDDRPRARRAGPGGRDGRDPGRRRRARLGDRARAAGEPAGPPDRRRPGRAWTASRSPTASSSSSRAS